MYDFSCYFFFFFFFSSRRRHTRWTGDWSSDVCSSDLQKPVGSVARIPFLGPKIAVKDGCKASSARSEGRIREIGRASCREKCRSRWSPYHEKKKRKDEIEYSGDNVGERCGSTQVRRYR